MAFVTEFVGSESGLISNAYNIDFSVGAGAKGNLPDDIALVQALFRIVHFEVSKPVPPPPTDKSIDVDGKFGSQTMRFILNWQRLAKLAKFKVLLDGIFDPFREQGGLSTIAKVRYTLEILNDTAFEKCKQDGIINYDELPSRADLTPALFAALNGPKRKAARKYESPA